KTSRRTKNEPRTMTRERTTIKADRGACGWRRPTGAATYSRSGARRAKWRTKQRSKGRAYASIFGLWRRRGASGGPGRPRALPLGLPDTLAAMNPHGGRNDTRNDVHAWGQNRRGRLDAQQKGSQP